MLIQLLHRTTLSRKVILGTLAVSFVTIILVLTANIYHQRYQFEQRLNEEMAALAAVVANRSTAALTFADERLSQANLDALAVRHTVEQACIYRINDGIAELFSNFQRGNTACASSPYNTTHNINNPLIWQSADVLLDDKVIGQVLVGANDSELHANELRTLLASSGVLLLSTIIAFWLSTRLERWLTGPLLQLRDTAMQVAVHEDYSIRAQKINEDEIGQVVEAFNHMLKVIESEDRRLRNSELRFRLFSSCSQAGIFQLDEHGSCVYVNNKLCEITGMEQHALMRDMWTHMVIESQQLLISQAWERLRSSGEPQNFHCQISTSQGDRWITANLGRLADEEGQTLGYLGAVTDVSELKQAQDQIERMAYYDVLTSLANRRLFRDRLDNSLQHLERHQEILGLLLIDLDQFKQINDTLGHDSGDTLLCLVAERLNQHVRKSDTVARLGGDEFAIIVRGGHHDQSLAAIATHLLEILRSPFQLQDYSLNMSASIGIAVAPMDGRDSESLIKHADLALYRAKDQGRNQFQFFTQEMNQRLIAHMQMVQNLKHALQEREFSVAYQPQVSFADGRVTGMETLVRWQHGEQWISPVDFIPVAEETGMIIPLGRWVLETSIRDFAQLRRNQLINQESKLSVNMSARQLEDDSLFHFIDQCLEEENLPAHTLELELTETVLMENLDECAERLAALQSRGITLAIDDFGTGYSSLAYLKRLPVDVLKVDRSFVKDIDHDPDDRSIVSAVIAMAHAVKYRVVAEGVETAEHVELLKAMHCDTAQGYFFSRPLSLSDLEQWLRDYQGSTTPATSY